MKRETVVNQLAIPAENTSTLSGREVLRHLEVEAPCISPGSYPLAPPFRQMRLAGIFDDR